MNPAYITHHEPVIRQPLAHRKRLSRSIVEDMMKNNPSYLYHALVTVWRLGRTNQSGLGFDAIDRRVIPTLAQQWCQTRRLSRKQITYLKKRLPRYHRQLLAAASLAGVSVNYNRNK